MKGAAGVGLGIGAASVAALLYVSCGPIRLGDGERRQMLAAITANVILPTYDDLAVRVQALRVSAVGFAAAPDQQTLEQGRDRWRLARLPLQEAESFKFGPATDQRLQVALDQSPVDYGYVEAEIAGTAELTIAYVDTLGANRKGFHAVEYLLFGASATTGTDPEILAAFSGDAAAAVRRRTFLVALVENLEQKASALQNAWSPQGGAYAVRFSEPGATGVVTTVKAAIDTVVNETVVLSESVADKKLGKPLGLGAGGTAQPALAESAPSDASISDMVANVRGIRNLYLGTRDGTVGLGLGGLVRKKSVAIDLAVRNSLAAATTALEAVPRPYVSSLVDQRPSVEAAYAAVKDLKSTLATDLKGILGATLKFNENDGD